MRRGNDSVETVNAAATAIVSAESRVQPVSVQKRRWGMRWSGYWCFGSHKNGKRIGHATLVPEPTITGIAANSTENSSHTNAVVLPFIAPPSSPASFLQSDPPSSTQSPGGFLSFTSLSANVYSPGPNSIFAIGPYAHETQLVSPPVFSNFTTEPNTAPVTPPPESLHQTTPSSPEVPFAQLLTSSLESSSRRTSVPGQKFPPSHYEFQSYYLYPGSPVGHLISPSSVISNSGTSSPFIDQEYASSGKHPFLEFRTGEPPKLWSIDGFSTQKWAPYQGSGSLTPDPAGPTQISEVASLAHSENGSQNNDVVIDHRVSFELTARDVANCLERHPLTLVESIDEATTETGNDRNKTSENEEPRDGQEPVLTTMGSVKEFKFVNPDEEQSDKPRVSTDWWTKEKVAAKESGSHSWTFFPMMQPGVS
ncbi:hypothetical protein ACHQM5_000572 [Ranunculus cassubicifolius]